jgi:hypothetical protein
MVISDKYKYVFVELPRTGTTAISKELVENYDGQTILWKHAPLNKFLEQASDEQRNYFKFACIRNPVDRTFSLYNKIKNDHGGEFSILKETRFKNLQAWYFYRQYLYIKENNASFVQYLKRFYSTSPYDDWITLDFSSLDSIIRFEHLNQDFKRTLEQIGIQPIRDLPATNKTVKSSALSNEISPRDMKDLNQSFGVYLSKMGLEFPDGLGKPEVTKNMRFRYEFYHKLKTIYWRFFKRAKFSKSEA